MGKSFCYQEIKYLYIAETNNPQSQVTNGSLLFLHWAPYLISVNSLLSHKYKVFPEVTSNSKSLVRGVGILSLRVICPCYIPRDIPVLALSLVSAHKCPLSLSGDSHCSLHAKLSHGWSFFCSQLMLGKLPWFFIPPWALPGGTGA